MVQIKYRQSYWSQIANPWVSASVLVGGLVSAVLLFGLYRLQNVVDTGAPYADTSALLGQ
jgi:hypothetical protein